MNTLSWLIYAAEVSERMRDGFSAIAFIAALVGCIGIPVLWVASFVELKRFRPAIVGTLIWLIVLVPALVGSWFLPSSKTIYMIAASEAGAQVVTSPDAVEMMDDLKTIIKQRLKKELEAK